MMHFRITDVFRQRFVVRSALSLARVTTFKALAVILVLGEAVLHRTFAQALTTSDPATWRTLEYMADWGLDSMHAADAYAAGFTGKGITVGVVDSGVYINNPEFADGRVKPLTITGTFGSNGYYFADASGAPVDNSPQPSFFTTGQSFNVPGTYNAAYDDPHGTHVTGTIAASRDGGGMQGVAFDANVFVTNTQSTDSTIYGPNADYNYFKAAYGTLAAAGARAINTSWGSPPPQDNYDTVQGLIQAYSNFSGQKSYLDAMGEVAQQYGVIQVIAAGNTAFANPNVRSSLPYFRPELENNWLVVGAAAQDAQGNSDPAHVVLASYSNKAGVDKYWFVVAPGSQITSTVPPSTAGDVWDPTEWGINPNQQTGYTTVSGTSMAAPHATGALAVLMQRFGYMTNEQVRDVLLTTAFHRDAVEGTPDANPNAPNAVWGWGVIDLKKAIKGPGQFLGAFAANLPAGTGDTWSNNISEDALIQRKQENAQEAASWAIRKATMDTQMTPAALQAAIPPATSALNVLLNALLSGSYQDTQSAIAAANSNPVSSAALKAFIATTQYWPYLNDDVARPYIGGLFAIYLQNAIATNYAQAISTAATQWQQEVATETTRIASFASNPTQGSLIKSGDGILTLSGINTYTGATVVNGGILSVSGSIATSSMTTVNAGGILTGVGIVGNTTINGGTFAPGNGNPGTSMTVNGSLAFQAAAEYLLQIGTTSSQANVTGTATLGNAAVGATFVKGGYFFKQYTILTATGGVTGKFAALTNFNLPPGFTSALNYDANDVFLNLTMNASSPLQATNGNRGSVANALANSFNSVGGIPTVFTGLSPAALTQISGETATGSQQTTFNAMSQFMGVMTDPFVVGRGDANAGATSGAVGYADEQALSYAQKRKPGDALAAIYAKAAPTAPVSVPTWSVWAAGFGGSQQTDGNAALGSNNTTSSVYGTAVGADYRLSPFTVAGFSTAGGGSQFNIVNGGGGRSDMFQAGAFIRHDVGAAYISGALAYGWQDITTNRTVTAGVVDQLRAEFNANSYSGRLEGGYRVVSRWMEVGFTPYAAGQFTTFVMPAYAENTVSGADTFGLRFGSQNLTDTRSELGFRTDKSFAMTGGVFTLRGRAAWAHDYDANRPVGATFQTLPDASFVVNGAAQARNSALTTAAAEWKWVNGWSVAATFEGEFSDVARSYSGKGTVRYAW